MRLVELQRYRQEAAGWNMLGWVSSFFSNKQVYLQALAERHARAMKHDPEIAFGDRKHRANLLAFDFIHFAQHENVCDPLRKLVQAVPHRLPEFGAMHYFIGLRLPLLWPFHVYPVPFWDELLRKFVGQ